MAAVGLVRIVTFLAAVVTAALLMTTQALAQGKNVDCGNGYYCPPGNACLMNNQCGVMIEAVPGSVQTSTGGWCDPGFRENKYAPGTCVPASYTECPSGLICPGGTTCSPDGTCAGGPPPTGPRCGSSQCAAGRICSSKGTCMNPEYFQDCGNGTICSKSAVCEFPTGCVLVGTQRTRQIAR